MTDSTSPKQATLLFLRRGDEILLAMKKRGFGKDKWNGVGGKVEAEETIQQALARECREEIGVIPMHTTKVAELNFEEYSSGEPHHMYVHVYLCDEWEGEPIETEEMAPQWFDIANIPYDSMWEDDTYWLPQVLGGQKVLGKFKLDVDGHITEHTVNFIENLPEHE